MKKVFYKFELFGKLIYCYDEIRTEIFASPINLD